MSYGIKPEISETVKEHIHPPPPPPGKHPFSGGGDPPESDESECQPSVPQRAARQAERISKTTQGASPRTPS